MIKLIKAKIKDSNYFLTLRNDETARKNSENSKIILKKDHIKWFNKAIINKNFKFFKILYKNRACGYVRLEKIKKNFYTSIFVTPEYRRKNVASKALIISEGYIDRSKYIFAKVRNSNLYSKKLFSKIGYEYFKNNGKFLLMKKKLGGLKVIDKIESIRGKNNFNWMNILRLAYKNSPKEASKIMSKIYKDDQRISKLVKKLIK
mgnify:FL=1